MQGSGSRRKPAVARFVTIYEHMELCRFVSHQVSGRWSPVSPPRTQWDLADVEHFLSTKFLFYGCQKGPNILHLPSQLLRKLPTIFYLHYEINDIQTPKVFAYPFSTAIFLWRLADRSCCCFANTLPLPDKQIIHRRHRRPRLLSVNRALCIRDDTSCDALKPGTMQIPK